MVFEVIASIAIIIWLLRRMHKHTKHNPAEKALKVHLAELESQKIKAKESSKEDE